MDGLLNTEGLKKLILEYQQAKQAEETRIYSADELAELNRTIAKHGGYSALSPNVKAQLENTYTPEQKSLRDWSNAKQAADRENSASNITGALGSLVTAGISDVFKGNLPGSAISNLHPVASMLNPVTFGLNVGTAGLSDLAYGIDKAGKTEGSWLDKVGAGIDRAVDINGAVDEGSRYAGDLIYKVAPSVSPYMQKAGTLLGGIIGSYIPVLGTAAGAAIGSGVGSKLGTGHRRLDYFGDLYDAGQAYVGSSLGGGLTGMLGKAVVNTGGNLLYPYINPDGKYVKNPDPNQLPLLQDQLISSGGDLLGTTGAMIGGLLSSPKQNPDLAPIAQQTPYPQVAQQQGLAPIDWEAELKKLSMPLEIKRKKEEEDTYMNYKFKPKDYLVNYL